MMQGMYDKIKNIFCTKKQEEVFVLLQEQEINDCTSINKNATESMLVCEPPENMPMIQNVGKTILKSAPDKYTKFVNKKYVKGDLVLLASDEGHLVVFS